MVMVMVMVMKPLVPEFGRDTGVDDMVYND